MLWHQTNSLNSQKDFSRRGCL